MGVTIFLNIPFCVPLKKTCYTGLEQHESSKSRQNYNFWGNSFFPISKINNNNNNDDNDGNYNDDDDDNNNSY